MSSAVFKRQQESVRLCRGWIGSMDLTRIGNDKMDIAIEIFRH